jgi:hypothetical protein
MALRSQVPSANLHTYYCTITTVNNVLILRRVVIRSHHMLRGKANFTFFVRPYTSGSQCRLSALVVKPCSFPAVGTYLVTSPLVFLFLFAGGKRASTPLLGRQVVQVVCTPWWCHPSWHQAGPADALCSDQGRLLHFLSTRRSCYTVV